MSERIGAERNPEVTVVSQPQGLIRWPIEPVSMGFVQRLAEGIDGMRRSMWDESGRGMKIVVLVVLIVTGLAIPLIPIAWIARRIAN